MATGPPDRRSIQEPQSLRPEHCPWFRSEHRGGTELRFRWSSEAALRLWHLRQTIWFIHFATIPAFALLKSASTAWDSITGPKKDEMSECEVPVWIKEGWEWMLNRVLGLPCQEPEWFRLPVMRRIAISTPNVMAALRHLRRYQARPYNFALSPVLVNLTGSQVTLLAPFEKDSSRWMSMPHINIHDGTTHTLDNPTLPLLVQTFEMVFHQYHRHPESKSFAPDGTPCKADSAGLLRRYPVTATGFHLIGKETERGWEQNDDISTLMPSLVRYGMDSSIADEQLRKRLLEIPLTFLEFETGLSRHTIVRARRGSPVHSRSLRLLKNLACSVPIRK